jgi:hypothetical protein
MGKTRFLLLLLLLCAPPLARAQGLDYSASIIGRTHAAAFAINPSLGYGQMLWGDRSSFKYGYVRPNVSLMATPTLFGVKPGIDFFPISILGFSASRTYSRRFASAKGYDCDAGRCQGTLHSTDLSGKLLLGYGSYFLSSQYTHVIYDEISGDQDILDPGTAAFLRRDGELSKQWTYILGKKVSKTEAAGLMHMTNALSENRSAQSAQYLFWRSDLPFPSSSATVAVGRFESSLKPLGFSLVLILNYTGRPSLALN